MSNNSLKLAWSTSFTITSLFLFWSDHQLTPVDCHAKDSKWCTQKLFRMTLSVKWYQQLSQECSEAWPGLSSPKFDLFFSSVLQYKSESLASESDPIFPIIFKIYTFHERAIFRIVWTWVQMERGAARLPSLPICASLWQAKTGPQLLCEGTWCVGPLFQGTCGACLNTPLF